MSSNVKAFIAVLALAGMLFMPACSDTEDVNSPKNGVTSSMPSTQSDTAGIGGNQTEESKNSENSENSKNSEGKVHVITNEKELEEYFNSISDEEIENLLKIIEDIDITNDVDLDTDPGFDQVEIPEQP